MDINSGQNKKKNKILNLRVKLKFEGRKNRFSVIKAKYENCVSNTSPGKFSSTTLSEMLNPTASGFT